MELRASSFLPWMPAGIAYRLDGSREWSATPGEFKALRRRKKFRPSKWAARYRVLPPKVSSRPGRWRNETTPYLRGIMDAAAVSCLRRIVICKGPQMGVTEAVHNFVGYTVDRAPGPVLYVFPDEDMARENMRDRIEPMVTATPRLREYLTGCSHDSQSLRIDLRHCNIYLAWARSASKLGNKPIRYLSLDEVDKYPPTAGRREASPIALALARVRTFPDHKIFEYSTPTLEMGNIWASLMACPLVFHYEARCPSCGKHQKMLFKQIKWPGGGDADPQEVVDKELAYYECAHCGAHWDDRMRDQAVRGGVFRDNRGRQLFYALKQDKPRRIGFHLPAWLSTFVSLHDVAAAWIKSHKNKVKLRNFLNNFAAEPWTEYEVERTEDRILALADDREPGMVPQDADVLLMGADTQDDGWWYEIRAWQTGPEMNNWQVRSGFVDSLAALEEVALGTVYAKPDGAEMRVRFGLVDAMGHRTTEVYDWCRRVRVILPCRGERSIKDRPVRRKWLKERGVYLWHVDTTYFKDNLSAKLEISAADPGAWLFHSGLPLDYARHYTAEYKDERGWWVCPAHRPNHLWDCSVYGLAAAEIFGVRFKQDAAQPQQAKSRKKTENPYTGGVNPLAR